MKRMKTRTDYYDEIRRGALMIVGALIGLFEFGQEKPAEGEAVGKEDQGNERVEKVSS